MYHTVPYCYISYYIPYRYCDAVDCTILYMAAEVYTINSDCAMLYYIGQYLHIMQMSWVICILTCCLLMVRYSVIVVCATGSV